MSINIIIMKYKYTLRLRDIENISQQNVDYVTIMKEVLGYNNYWFGRKFVYQSKLMQAHYLVTQSKNVDPTKVELNPDCEIKVPNNIDSITFRAMMELQATLGNSNEENFTQTIAQIISIVCYQENCDGDYDSNCKSFLKFKERVLNAPIWDMMGIYNWIYKKENESKITWQQRFMSVSVEDQDYQQAGGASMQQFNVINTLKMLCRDFNCTDDRAWQKSYALSQTNSYSLATQNFVQDQMRKIKEVKMKKARNAN